MDIKPIRTDDKESVAEFLHENLFKKISVDQWISGLFPHWSEEFPAHGHMMVDNDRIVGVQIVIYSRMLIGGKEAVFGNLSSWCVLEEYRKGLSSIMLMRKNVSDKSVNYTVTTPNDVAQRIFSKFGFETIDNGIYLIPNIPAFYSKRKIVTDIGEIPRKLDESNSRIFNDHKHIPWLKHLVIVDKDEVCYVIYRDWKTRHSKTLKNSRLLYISNPHALQKNFFALRGYFLMQGYPATTINRRFLTEKPFLAFDREGSKPICFRGADTTKEHFTNAYTQVMTFEAHY